MKKNLSKVFEVHVLSVPSLTLRSCINGLDDRAQIYDGQIIPDPPTVLLLTGGGGSESMIRPARI
jgi:hypothetical protein